MSTNRKNPAKYLKDDLQKESLSSLTNVDDGKFYTMNYLADYKLDELLQADAADTLSQMEFLRTELLTEDMPMAQVPSSFGCSAFTVASDSGNVLYGRNFDYKMDMTALMVRLNPKNGYKSINLVDTGWLGYGIGSLDDGVTDFSALMAAPYIAMDGMNEKGLAVCLLTLKNVPIAQSRGKKKINMSTAVRLVLDRAKTVEEAITLMDQYDMHSIMPDFDLHFLLADATGKTVVVEYCYGQMQVLDEPCVTNFYLAPVMDGLGQGRNRYEILKGALTYKRGKMNMYETMALLSVVGEREKPDCGSITQWSAIYDLTNCKATVAIRGNYEKLFRFSIEGTDA